MKRPVVLDPNVDAFHKRQSPETQRGLSEVYTQFGDDFERTGYEVRSRRGYKSAHVNHYGIEWESIPLRVIATVVKSAVTTLETVLIACIGGHTKSSDGNVSVYEDERVKSNHRKHRR